MLFINQYNWIAIYGGVRGLTFLILKLYSSMIHPKINKFHLYNYTGVKEELILFWALTLNLIFAQNLYI